MFKTIITSIVTSLIVSLVICGLFISNGGANLGGDFETVKQTFMGGIEVQGPATFSSTISQSGATTFTGGLTIGSTGSSISKVITGAFTNTSCTGPATQGITQISTYYCTATGAVNNDKIFVTLASTTPNDIFVVSAHASTTGSDQIVLRIGNASSTALAATTTAANFLIVR